MINCLKCLGSKKSDINIWVLTELNQRGTNCLLHHLHQNNFHATRTKNMKSKMNCKIFNNKLVKIQVDTHRLINYGDKGLQHLCHIELNVGYSEEKTKNNQASKQVSIHFILSFIFGRRSIKYIYLSFDAVTTTGSSFEHVISEPITGARRQIARRIVIRYK